MEKIIVNRCRCKKCGDVIESTHQHHMAWCKCGSIFTDGGTAYVRRGGSDLDLIEDLSVYQTDEMLLNEKS